MEFETRGGQRRSSIIGEGTSHRATIAPNNLCFRITSGFQLTFNGPHAADVFFEFLFGVSVGFIDRPSGFSQVMEVTQLMGYLGQGVLDGFTD